MKGTKYAREPKVRADAAGAESDAGLAAVLALRSLATQHGGIV
jgi:hypothetical protein